MPQLKGQVGTNLEVTLNSVLVGCCWSLSKAAVGADLWLVAMTAYVGDGCPFCFTLLDETGKTIDTLQAVSRSNVCNAKWILPDKIKGHLWFVVEAPSVGLKGRSDVLEVVEQAKIGPVEALDAQGGALSKVGIGQKVRWKAAMRGVPAGTQAKWILLCRHGPADPQTMATRMVEVQQSQAVMDWEARVDLDQANTAHQTELDKSSETYQDTTFEASFRCLGVTATSQRVPVSHSPLRGEDAEAKREIS